VKGRGGTPLFGKRRHYTQKEKIAGGLSFGKKTPRELTLSQGRSALFYTYLQKRRSSRLSSVLGRGKGKSSRCLTTSRVRAMVPTERKGKPTNPSPPGKKRRRFCSPGGTSRGPGKREWHAQSPQGKGEMQQPHTLTGKKLPCPQKWNSRVDISLSKRNWRPCCKKAVKG